MLRYKCKGFSFEHRSYGSVSYSSISSGKKYKGKQINYVCWNKSKSIGWHDNKDKGIPSEHDRDIMHHLNNFSKVIYVDIVKEIDFLKKHIHSDLHYSLF